MGASLESVNKVMSDRLPPTLVDQRDRQKYLTRSGAVCFVLDREMPSDVPLHVRR
jgi:hypothetical protein